MESTAAVLARSFALMLKDPPSGAQAAQPPLSLPFEHHRGNRSSAMRSRTECRPVSKVGRYCPSTSKVDARVGAERRVRRAQSRPSISRRWPRELTSVGSSVGGEWVVFVRGGDHGSNWDDGCLCKCGPAARSPPSRRPVVPFASRSCWATATAVAARPCCSVLLPERDRRRWLVPIPTGRSPQSPSSPPTGRAAMRRGRRTGRAWAFVSGSAATNRGTN